MKKALLILTVIVANLASAQKFEEGMGRALTLWKEGKADQATALLERIAAAEPKSWLPNYYIALINTTQAFSNPSKMDALLEKAQASIDAEMAKDPANAELHVVQAMAYTARIASDPMSYGMAYSPRVMESYAKALAIDPSNPRAVFGKAEFDLHSAPYTGADTKPICAQIDRAIELFATFKPASALHPSWGLDRAVETRKNCK